MAFNKVLRKEKNIKSKVKVIDPFYPSHTHLALSQQGLYLSTFDDAVVFHIAWNRRTVVDRPMDLQVPMDNFQISLFALQHNSSKTKGDFLGNQ